MIQEDNVNSNKLKKTIVITVLSDKKLKVILLLYTVIYF